ncbi:transcriptional regulator, AraC family [Variovorax sp. OK605]|jgi:AraC-like DNA-binding protein|nr:MULTISPECIES: AraC family transcriptional regulator [unclassified Variovorax]SEJ91306.1 AraC-type DNA-binding protein [Variovorax sp. OK202]SFD09233.1 AraC-type DNA-binding protein [Variovorax sp. OK212]SFP08296.1 transcriptional regulator, AraC family [Variovorax sp. OK605]
MPSPHLRSPRHLLPELEVELARSTDLGYEPAEEVGLVRCLEHGFPTPLARWHCHEEYELHLIVATSGQAFVGDWIGSFDPGHLVLCGPKLPHNWISLDAPAEGVAQRDLVIQFLHDPIFEAAQRIPELLEAVRMLERARFGIEFFGMAERAEQHFRRVKAARGLKRFSLFCDFLADMAQCDDYRLLSGMQTDGDPHLESINDVVTRIANEPSKDVCAADIAAELGMHAGRFSRLFRRATGHSFLSYVNQVRVNKACLMLMHSDRYVTSICYEVGFNNVSNFNRKFLEIKGLTPTEFRRQSQLRLEGAMSSEN